jgi:pimeloyl-ACP methyl ester carboxylesterase
MIAEPLVAWNHGIRLAGTLWMPMRTPRALVMMHPGSGPSDRDNDVLFPPIRNALLDAAVAVCSFDKRGVGGSSGSWLEAGITAQAEDLLAGTSAAKTALGEIPTGLFGHSQGGWVVLEAAAAQSPEFVITNSGPAVSPREQETYSTLRSLQRRGCADAVVREAMAEFRQIMNLLDLPFEAGWTEVEKRTWVPELLDAGAFIPSDPALWAFASQIIDHDPRPALRDLAVPLLSLYGEDDSVVPVQDSAAIVSSLVPSELLDLRIFPGGDHRIEIHDEFVDGYLESVVDFVDRVVHEAWKDEIRGVTDPVNRSGR